MRFVGLILLGSVAACGQMYDRPGGQPPPPQQQAQPQAPADPEDPQQPQPPQEGEGPPGQQPQQPQQPRPPEARPVTRLPPGLSADAQAWVDAHNRVRAKHCAAPLAWAPKLAEAAQKWANALRDKGCAFEHSQNNPYGENLAGGTIGALDPSSTVDYWYSEIKQYQFPSGGFSMDTGHFTQVVWANTTSVGCGRAQCKGNDIFVCEYDPPGNYDGEYEKNVRPVGCK